jgi:folylpolyglutamate synthase/dihydropteroate synthase
LKTLLVLRFFIFILLLGIFIFLEIVVNIAIIETGIGGEIDLINVFSYLVAIGIISIRIDYIYILRDIIKKITWYKVGIFKPDLVVGIMV